MQGMEWINENKQINIKINFRNSSRKLANRTALEVIFGEKQYRLAKRAHTFIKSLIDLVGQC